MKVHPKCVQLRIGRDGVTPHMYVRTCNLYKLIFFHVFGSIFALLCLIFLVEFI